MGLLIKSTENQKIVIAGTEIEMQEIYGRLEFAGRADGKTLEVAVTTYASKEAFKKGASALTTNVQQGSFSVELLEGEKQGVDEAHAYALKAFVQLGFECTTDLA
jgi:hypothetical protein